MADNPAHTAETLDSETAQDNARPPDMEELSADATPGNGSSMNLDFLLDIPLALTVEVGCRIVPELYVALDGGIETRTTAHDV